MLGKGCSESLSKAILGSYHVSQIMLLLIFNGRIMADYRASGTYFTYSSSSNLLSEWGLFGLGRL